MKKLLFSLLLVLSIVYPSWADKTIMNNTWGYSYYSYANLNNLSYQDILYENTTNAVVVYGAAVNFNKVDFKNNTSHGLYLHQDSTLITLNNMHFYNNTSGAASFWQREQSISNSFFEHNSHTSGFGGALYIPHKHTLTINNVSFADNSAAKGGAIYAGNNLVLQGGNLTFSNNSSLQGGGIYANGNLTVSATNGDITFSGNTGGAIYMERGTLTLQPKGGSIIFNDDILSSFQTNIVVAGGERGQVKFNHALSNAAVTLQSGVVYLNPNINWEAMTLNSAGGSLSLVDGSVHNLRLGDVHLNHSLHVVADVNLQTDTMDSLNIGSVSGTGDITIDGFNLLREDTQGPSIVDFMTGAKPTVHIPRTVNGSIYAYDVSYNPSSGEITFVPRSQGASGQASSTSFNPAVLIQPLRSYMALYMLQNSITPMQHRKQIRFLHYEDASASFYLTPYMSRGKLEFTNELKTDFFLSGVQAGWTSADWGIADGFAITGGFNVGYMGENSKYQYINLDMKGYQAGVELNIYSGDFWFGLTGQAAAISSEVKENKQTALALWGEAAVKYHMLLADNGWLLTPYAQAGYGFTNKMTEMQYAGNTLHSGQFLLLQMQTGAEIIKSYNDVWHWYFGGALVKQITNADEFYAASVRLPGFAINPFVQVQAGFQTENDGRFVFGGALTGSFGSAQQFGAQLLIQF